MPASVSVLSLLTLSDGWTGPAVIPLASQPGKVQPMTGEDLASLTATEIASRVSSREVSPVQVVEAALARVDRLNSTLNAVVTLNERALDDARALEKSLMGGSTAGLLCGVPVGIKDVTPVAGLRTTYGSLMYADHVPDEDAVVVERLRRAGGIILGKTPKDPFSLLRAERTGATEARPSAHGRFTACLGALSDL